MAAFLKRRTGRTNGRTGNTQSQPGLNLDTEILQKMKILALPYVTVLASTCILRNLWSKKRLIRKNKKRRIMKYF